MFEIEELHYELLCILKYVDKTLREYGLWYSLAYGSVLGAVRHNGFIPWDPDADIYITLKERDLVRSVLKAHLPEEFEYLDSSENSVAVFDNIRSRKYGDFAQLDIYILIGAPNVSLWSSGKIGRLLLRNKIWVKLTCTKYGDSKKLQSKLKLIPFWVARGLLRLVPDKLIRKMTSRLELQYNYDSSPFLASLVVYDKVGGFMERELYLNTKDSIFEDAVFRIPENSHEYLISMYGVDYMIPKQRNW